MARPAYVHLGGNGVPHTAWLRCPACGRGAVREGDTVSPSPKPLSDVRGLADNEKAIWAEVRDCLSVGASTATVMLCRKLLYNLAVAKGMDETDAKGRAHNFYESVEHLKSAGYVTPPMQAWVGRIKDVGNEANHKVVRVDAQEAMKVAVFTEQLLILAFQMDKLMEEVEDDATPGASATEH